MDDWAADERHKRDRKDRFSDLPPETRIRYEIEGGANERLRSAVKHREGHAEGSGMNGPEEIGDTCDRCGVPLPDDRTYCEDCEAVVILEQLEPGERAA